MRSIAGFQALCRRVETACLDAITRNLASRAGPAPESPYSSSLTIPEKEVRDAVDLGECG